MFNVKITGLEGTKKLLNRVAKQSPLAAQNILKEYGKRTKNYAKRNIKSATGDTANKILMRTGSKFVEVMATAPQSIFVELGFNMGGKVMPFNQRTGGYAGLYGFKSFRTFAQAVTARGKHEGQHFMSKAYNQVVRESRQIIDAEWNKLFSSKIGDF